MAVVALSAAQVASSELLHKFNSKQNKSFSS